MRLRWLLLCLCWIGLAGAEEGEFLALPEGARVPRQFTSAKSGKTFTATLLAFQGEIVYLNLADGRAVKVRLDQFEMGDRTHLAKLQAQLRADPDSVSAEDVAGPREVPVGEGALAIPGPSILTDPYYRVAKPPPGEGDGKTLGPDGRPLADHHLYANDCRVFVELLRRGLALRTADEEARLQALREVAENRAKQRQQAIADYEQRYGNPPARDPLYLLLQLTHAMDQAQKAYREARSRWRREARCTERDRLDLRVEAAPRHEDERQAMIAALTKLHRHRHRLERRYQNFYQVGRADYDREVAGR